MCENVSKSVARMAVAYAEDISLEYQAKQKEAVKVANIEAKRVVKNASNPDEVLQRSLSMRARSSSDMSFDTEDLNHAESMQMALDIAPSLTIRMGIISLAEKELFRAPHSSRERTTTARCDAEAAA